MSFSELGLAPTLLQAITDTGYTTPTPIQQQAIPVILNGGDVMAAAQTGTGKTAGFTLPLLQRLSGKAPARSNHVRALVLTPTRELAAQIQESIETYGKHEKLRSVVVFGGVNINPQQMALRKGCDILVATPGRLLDLYGQNAVKFTDLETLVLDEADRMLDMGFIRDIRRILALLPKQRQNLLFSATFSPEIRALAKGLCVNPLEIDVAPRNSTVDTITQELYMVGKDHKQSLLAKLLLDTKEQVLVFSRTKHGANNLVKKLAGYGITAAAIHGNKSQNQRTKALADFKASATQVLVATDIAARGIDIDQLAMVINFDLPQVSEDYVHRIGRTGRAGASGLAVSLVSEEDEKLLRDIERLIKRRITRRDFEVSALPQRPAEAPQAAPAARPASNNNSGRGRNNTPRPRRDNEQPQQRAQSRKPQRDAAPASTGTSTSTNSPSRRRGGGGARPGGQGTGSRMGQSAAPGILHRDPRQMLLEREEQLQRQEGQKREGSSLGKAPQGNARGQGNGNSYAGANSSANATGNGSANANGSNRNRRRGPRPSRPGQGGGEAQGRSGQSRSSGHGNSQRADDQNSDRGLWTSLRGFFGNK